MSNGVRLYLHSEVPTDRMTTSWPAILGGNQTQGPQSGAAKLCYGLKSGRKAFCLAFPSVFSSFWGSPNNFLTMAEICFCHEAWNEDPPEETEPGGSRQAHFRNLQKSILEPMGFENRYEEDKKIGVS